tara:strand:- start:14 stop:1048 length:1035 start_codon:yes stop_codon:yes gene_type:complete
MELTIGVDYLPLGRSDLSDLTDSESGVLLKILMTSDHNNMFKSKRPKGADSVLKSLHEKGYINLSEALVYLNFENDLFKHFLAKECIYINNNKKVNTKPKSKAQISGLKKAETTSLPKEKPLADYFNEKDYLKRVSPKHIQIMTLINSERAKLNLMPLKRWSRDHESSITFVLKNYSLDDIFKVIISFFKWQTEGDPGANYQTMNSKFQPKKILGGNFKGKLYYAKEANTDIGTIDIPLQESSEKDQLSLLYNLLVTDWDRIQNKEVKIELEGEMSQIQIASLAFKKFKSRLSGKHPKYVDSPEKLFRSCYTESEQTGGAMTTALDDLNINGHIYSVEILKIEV